VRKRNGKPQYPPLPHSSELPQAKASSINATTNATPQHTTTTTTSDVEIALACSEVELTKETETKEKIRHKLTWEVPVAKYAYKPADAEDEQEAYGQYVRQENFPSPKCYPNKNRGYQRINGELIQGMRTLASNTTTRVVPNGRKNTWPQDT
jgi:hypothetical protein